MSKALWLIIASAIAVAACGSGPAPPPFKPIADNKVLMNSVLDPNADIVWDAVKYIQTAQGSEEIKPRTEEEWNAVRRSAVALAESGNLLMMAPRAKDGDAWMKASEGLILTSEAAIKAIDARNADDLFMVGGDIYSVCTNCHTKYQVKAPINQQTN